MKAKSGWSLFLNLLPLILPLMLFAAGIFFTILQSFCVTGLSYKYPSPFYAYRVLFGDGWFVRSWMFSMFTAFVSAAAATAAGAVLSWWIWNLPVEIRPYAFMQRIFLILPHIAVAYIIIILLGRTGVISSMFYHAGLIRDYKSFPTLVFTGSGIDIITGYFLKETPFVMVLVLGILAKLDPRIIETAEMLGAGKLTIFFRLAVPFIMPVLNTSFIILFIYSFGAFDLPYVLGDSYPGMLSIRVYEYYFQRDLYYRPVAMAVLSLIFIFAICFVALYSRLVGKLSDDVRKI